jgi:hypothetical protein
LFETSKKSLIIVGLNSTEYILPSQQISDRCEGVVPAEAPKYNTFDFLVIGKVLKPLIILAANFERLGFHKRNSLSSNSNSFS